MTGERNVGTSRPRLHDSRLLRGHGRYVDDVEEFGARHAAILRSPVAHGRIVEFDPSPAVAAGAALVLGPDEIPRLTEPIPAVWLLPGQQLDHIPTADRTVRYAGQPIGVVVAGSRAEAEDLAELIRIEIEPLPAVVGVEAALAESAPLVHPDNRSNMAGRIHFGDPVSALAEAVGAATHVVERTFTVQRVAHSPMEPRGVLAEWTAATQRLTVWASSQAPQVFRQTLGTCLRLRMDQVRVISPDIGGAFGGKALPQVDEVLVCLTAVALGGRVKWIEDRAENLTASYQGRGQVARGRLALDRDGAFRALQVEVTGDLGAYATQAGSGPFQVTGMSAEGPYRFPAAGATVAAVYTHAVPTGAYRGYGMQEAAWIRERLIDEAARELGLDPVGLRMRNLITPAQLPYTTRCAQTYDSGDYPMALCRAADLAADRRRPSHGRVRRGVGLACGTEITGFAPTALLEKFRIGWAGWESGRIRVNPDGTVTVFSGVISLGQGIETALAQIIADRLEIPLEWISVQLGDTDSATHSDLTSQASRSLALAGGALMLAGDRMRGRMHRLAAHLLGVPGEDVKWDGTSFVAGGITASWREVAQRGWHGWGRDDPERIALEETVDFDPPAITYAYSVSGAAVAVDLDTGIVTVEDYWSVNDSGVLVNPLIADGQIIGGIVQGLGLALLEEAGHAPGTGAPLHPTLGGYLLPTAAVVPDVEVTHLSNPSTVIPGGFKGLGEGGIIPAPAAVGNAVADAVPEIALALVSTPMSPERVWQALQERFPSR